MSTIPQNLRGIKAAVLSEADRRAVVEILRETLHDLPSDFCAPDRVE